MDRDAGRYKKELEPRLADSQEIEAILGQFVVNLTTQPGQIVPLDLIDRFCEAMSIWTSHGFFTLFTASGRKTNASTVCTATGV